MGMSKKPTPLASRTCSDSKSVFMRERLILNVANLRYELDIIRFCIRSVARSATQDRDHPVTILLK